VLCWKGRIGEREFGGSNSRGPPAAIGAGAGDAGFLEVGSRPSGIRGITSRNSWMERESGISNLAVGDIMTGERFENGRKV